MPDPNSIARFLGRTDPFAVDLANSYGLTLAILGGTLDVDGAWATVADQTVTIEDGATNYVERTLDGVASANTTFYLKTA